MATANDLPPPQAPLHPSSHQSHQFRQSFQPQYLPPNKQQPPVTQQQRPTTQTRKSRSFSFRSDNSHGSNDLHETPQEKEAKRLHSKADPTLAMNEAEPSEVAATGKSSLAPLRSIQHKDPFGNPIADPDRSNPTRSRWERPLDTIRSFEAAIDGGYSNRRSILRSDSESIAWGGNNRRSSYYQGGSTQKLPRVRQVVPLTVRETDGNGGRFSHDSYYGSRPPSMMYSGRPDGGGSQHDLRQLGGAGPRDNYHEQGPGGSYTPAPPNQGRRGYPRMMSEPHVSSSFRQQPNPNEYAIPNNHRSYETVASASGSGSSAEPLGYQTDPTSSDNSSVERVQAPPKPLNDYGIGFSSQSPAYQPPVFTVGGGGGGGGRSGGLPPPVPQKGPAMIQRKPTANAQLQLQLQQRPVVQEKRKSWFARRFSKQG